MSNSSTRSTRPVRRAVMEIALEVMAAVIAITVIQGEGTVADTTEAREVMGVAVTITTETETITATRLRTMELALARLLLHQAPHLLLRRQLERLPAQLPVLTTLPNMPSTMAVLIRMLRMADIRPTMQCISSGWLLSRLQPLLLHRAHQHRLLLLLRKRRRHLPHHLRVRLLPRRLHPALLLEPEEGIARFLHPPDYNEVRTSRLSFFPVSSGYIGKEGKGEITASPLTS